MVKLYRYCFSIVLMALTMLFASAQCVAATFCEKLESFGFAENMKAEIVQAAISADTVRVPQNKLTNFKTPTNNGAREFVTGVKALNSRHVVANQYI